MIKSISIISAACIMMLAAAAGAHPAPTDAPADSTPDAEAPEPDAPDSAEAPEPDSRIITDEDGAEYAAPDVEPLPEDSALWDIPNLLLTPHVAGGMRLEITRRTCIEMAQENLRRYLAGEPLNNRVR